jgi:hypothetical protein
MNEPTPSRIRLLKLNKQLCGFWYTFLSFIVFLMTGLFLLTIGLLSHRSATSNADVIGGIFFLVYALFRLKRLKMSS